MEWNVEESWEKFWKVDLSLVQMYNQLSWNVCRLESNLTVIILTCLFIIRNCIARQVSLCYWEDKNENIGTSGFDSNLHNFMLLGDASVFVGFDGFLFYSSLFNTFLDCQSSLFFPQFPPHSSITLYWREFSVTGENFSGAGTLVNL